MTETAVESDVEMMVGESEPNSTTIVSESSDSESEVAVVEPQVDFMEIYSPKRVFWAVRARNCKCHPSLSLDLLNGYDFMSVGARAKCLRLMDEYRPKFLMLSPPCTMYSALQALNFAKMREEVLQERWQEAHALLDFAMLLAEKQVRAGRYFAYEHPVRASSWKRASVTRVVSLPGCYTVSFDQCQTGLVTPGENPQPIQKRTTLLTNAPCMREIFEPLQCTCDLGSHHPIQGSINGIQLSKWCQHYTPKLCDHLAEAVDRTVRQ